MDGRADLQMSFQVARGVARMPHPRSCTLFALALVGLGISTARAAEPYNLRPALQPNSFTHVEIILQVGGEAILAGEGKRTSLPLSVVANIGYDEKLLAVEPSAVGPRRSLRYYDDARVAIKVDNGGQKPVLRESRRLISTEAGPNSVTLFSPSGPLTRDELDLIDLPATSLVVDELLPREPVEVGSTWSHTDQLIASLLGLDAVSKVSVTSRLTEVSDGTAKVVLEGTLRGATAGIGTQIELKAKYNFDLKAKRINWFALLVKEKRAIGHVGPGLDVVAKVIMKVTPATQSVHLPAEIADKLSPLTGGVTELEYEAPSGAFRFEYGRGWYITSEEKNVAILRLVDRGELVAQCNISPLPTVPKQLTLAEYQEEIAHSLDKSFGQFVEASQDVNEAGCTVYRVVANGTVSSLPIQWVYYLLTNPEGERVSLSFTMESALGERFAAADRQLVGSVQFTKPPVNTSRKPSVVR
jgi:hypothetical protein